VGQWIAVAVAIAVVGAIVGAPGLFLVAAITFTYGTLTRLWTRYGMRDVQYRRRLGGTRTVVGDTVTLDIRIWNRKPLPLPWVSADDLVTDGLVVRERPDLDLDAEQIGRRHLHNAWSLAWFERVVRHYHIDADRRGHFEFGPVRLLVRDILGRDAAAVSLDLPAILNIAPRTLPLRRPGSTRAPLGDRRARRSLFHDPALFGGVRPFQPGDPLRRVHWRATARLGVPVARRYEPAQGREVIIALDSQTIEGPHWEMAYDDAAFEGLCVAAASIARRWILDGAACGLAAASFTGTAQRIAWLAPSASVGQVTRVGELLARMGPVSSGPYEQLLTWLTRRLAPGCTVFVLTARDPRRRIGVLRRLILSGYDVEVIAMGDNGVVQAQALRTAGIRASVARLSPDWKRAHALELAV
jgi:uncharacterized protein (DUF58 family)